MTLRSGGLTLAFLLSMTAFEAPADDPAPQQPATNPAEGPPAPAVVPPTPKAPPIVPPPSPPISFAALDPIIPQAPAAIPDDPPPHEGAFFDLPLTVAPPDIIIVEVLEAQPGRPITGERLVRPDGKISLGFYGEVYVRGLTVEQVKLKIILHLRDYLADEVLGLVRYVAEEAEPNPGVMEGRAILPNEPSQPPDPSRPPVEKQTEGKRPEPPPDLTPPVPPSSKPQGSQDLPNEGPTQRPENPATPATTPPTADASNPSQDPPPPPPVGRRVSMPDGNLHPAFKESLERIPLEPPSKNGWQIIADPALSDRVFVDIVKYCSNVYYVRGDVHTPGRLPFTGQETVLDAIEFSGGLLASGDRDNIHLYRPARGDKPARDYKINYRAILQGDRKANLQVFPGDRLVIGRHPQFEDDRPIVDR